MATGVINTIGFVSGILGIVGFALDNIPDSTPDGNRVSIKAGLECLDGCTDFGGTVYEVYGWNGNNQLIGTAGGSNIPSDGLGEYTLDQGDNPGSQAAYIGVNVENDALCIQWISVVQRDGSKAGGGAYNGDIGTRCGQLGYYNKVGSIAGNFKDEDGGGPWRPACSWLDGDKTNGITDQSLKFRVAAYGDLESQATRDGNLQCSSTIFSPGERAIAGQPTKRDVAPIPLMRGTEKPRKKWMENQLIVSDTFEGHNATALCLNDMMWGPDFIGSDGYFCDMGNRDIVPLCSHKDVEGCIVIDKETTAIMKRSSVAKRQVHTTHRSYTRLTNWASGEVTLNPPKDLM